MTEYSKGGADQGGAGSEAREAAREVRQGLGEAARETKERTRSYLDKQKESAAQRAHELADALRDTARDLEDRDEASPTSHFTERAAEGIDRLADTLESKDMGSLLRETERFARSSPALFIGGAVLAGVLLGRFLRSSRSHDHSGDTKDGSPPRHETGNGRRSQQSGDRLPGRGDHDPARFTQDSGSRTSPSDPSDIHRSPWAPPSGGQQ